MSKYVNEVQQALQYTDAWLELGVITPEIEGEFWHEWQKGRNRQPAHYRWRAFTLFLQTNLNWTDELFKQLYALGASDPDTALGAALQRELLSHAVCPNWLLEQALQTGETQTVNVARHILRCRHSTQTT